MLSVGLAACTESVVDRTAAETAPVVGVAQQRRWADLAIDDYRVVYEIHNLNDMSGSGSGGDGLFDVTVHDGKVAECTIADVPLMASGPCLLPIPEPVDLLSAWLAVFDDPFTVVRYHPEWHYPEAIDYDNPATSDEEYRIRVLEFEKLVGG